MTSLWQVGLHQSLPPLQHQKPFWQCELKHNPAKRRVYAFNSRVLPRRLRSKHAQAPLPPCCQKGLHRPQILFVKPQQCPVVFGILGHVMPFAQVSMICSAPPVPRSNLQGLTERTDQPVWLGDEKPRDDSIPALHDQAKGFNDKSDIAAYVTASVHTQSDLRSRRDSRLLMKPLREWSEFLNRDRQFPALVAISAR